MGLSGSIRKLAGKARAAVHRLPIVGPGVRYFERLVLLPWNFQKLYEASAVLHEQMVRQTEALVGVQNAVIAHLTNFTRDVQNNQALLPLIEETFKSAPRAHWLERLAKHDIPVAPVQTVAEFMEHPAVRHHDLVHEYEHPEVGRLRMMGQPLVFDDTPTRDPGPPPTLGQHTGEILTELGYSGAAIADLRQRRVLGGPAE